MNNPTLKVTFLLPKKDNEGQDLSTLLGEIETAIIQTFGGLTVLGDCQGYWKMSNGEIAHDNNKVYSLVLKQSQYNDLEEILLLFKGIADQESIYLEKQEMNVLFL